MRINLYLTFLPRCEVCAAGLSYNCFFFWSQTILPRTKQTDEGNENKTETPNLSAHSQRGHHLIMLLPRKAWDQASGKLILLSIHFKSVLSTHIFYNLKPKELLEFQFSVFFLFFFQFSLSKTKLEKREKRKRRRRRWRRLLRRQRLKRLPSRKGKRKARGQLVLRLRLRLQLRLALSRKVWVKRVRRSMWTRPARGPRS